jgi:hypothetical protein
MTDRDRSLDPEGRPYPSDATRDRTGMSPEAQDEDYARGLREGVEINTGDRGDYARGLDAESPTADPDYARGLRDLPHAEDEISNPPRGDFARGQREDDDLDDPVR